MPNVLQSRRDSSRFQILVEIAAHQPNIRQKEVADKLGVTPQAVSEYIKELVADGLVETDGRMRYRITKRGVEWLLESAAELKRYARVVMEEIINHVSVWPAIARDEISEGERVTLVMEDGLLYATRYREDIEASGIAISDASKGEDVGISDLRGLISLEEGRIKVCKVPRVQLGGSRQVDLEALARLLPAKGIVGALGIEALVSLRKVGREPDIFFGSKEAVVEAAYHGVSSLIVSVDEQIPGILNRLESEGIKYELVDLTKTR